MALQEADMNYVEIRVKRKTVKVPTIRISGQTVVTTGGWLKTATVQDEEFLEEVAVQDPELFVRELKQSALKADIFTFAQRLPEIAPKYKYHLECDSVAAIPITNVQDWLTNHVEYDVRKAIKRAARRGVTVKEVEFNDDFVRGITQIYSESAVRQGKPFWHYGKDFETIKKEKITYLDRSEFIGAYFENELIGFIKMVCVGKVASTFHVISMQKHASMKPTNALIAKAVEICQQKGRTHLVYGEYAYGASVHQRYSTSKTEFKRRSGFQEFLVPRYYVPLTPKGSLCLKLGLHRGIKAALPRPVIRSLRAVRSAFYRSVKS